MSNTSISAATARQRGDATDGSSVIREGRARIDELDQAIIDLIAQRQHISRIVQQARVAAGGRRLELSREGEILARYHEALGRHGTTIAMSILDLCRGALAARGTATVR